MPKKGSKKPQISSDITSANLDKQVALERLLQRSNWMRERRIKTVEAQETALLALAIALMDLKEALGCSWRELASVHLKCADGSTLYKLVNRSLKLKAQFYTRLTQSINCFLESSNSPLVSFPEWTED